MPKIVEVSAEFTEKVSSSRVPTATWPVGFVLGLGVLVALSAGSSFTARVEPPEALSDVRPIATPTRPETPTSLSLFLPAAGDVVLGSCVPVAGRVTPSNSRSGPAQPTSVSVVIANGTGIVGKAELPIVNVTFAGCVPVESPQKGRRFELAVTFTAQPEREPARVSMILATASNTGP